MIALGLLLLAAQPAPAQMLAPELQPLAFLVGSCWRTTMANGHVTDTHCFTSMYGGRFVRDRHRMAGADYAGETIYRWDSGSRQIRFDYYQSQGLIIRGTTAPSPQGLAFALSIPLAEPPTEMRGTWTRDGDDAYVVSQEIRSGDSWRPVAERPRFVRVSAAPAD
jgi:hypothetical protein